MKCISADEYKNILHKEINKMYEFRSAEEIEQNPFEEEKVKAKKEAFYCAITKAMEMPSVEVVRCEDCKKFRNAICGKFKICTNLTDYCSYGERKGDD